MYIRCFKWRLCKRVNAFVEWTNPNSIYCRRHVVDKNFFYHGHRKWGFLKGTLKLRVYWMRKLRTWFWRLRMQYGLKSRYSLLPLTLSTFGNFFLYNEWFVFHHNTYIPTYIHTRMHKNTCHKNRILSFLFRMNLSAPAAELLTIQINQPTRCKNSSRLLHDVYVQLNKFRASSRPSSGAQQLQ